MDTLFASLNQSNLHMHHWIHLFMKDKFCAYTAKDSLSYGHYFMMHVQLHHFLNEWPSSLSTQRSTRKAPYLLPVHGAQINPSSYLVSIIGFVELPIVYFSL